MTAQIQMGPDFRLPRKPHIHMRKFESGRTAWRVSHYDFPEYMQPTEHIHWRRAHEYVTNQNIKLLHTRVAEASERIRQEGRTYETYVLGH